MKSWPAISLMLVTAALSSGLPVMADDTQPAPVKASALSSPVEDTDLSASRLDDLFPAQTTSSLFGNNNSGSAPLPPPPVNNRPADNKNDWILMTPEEILGVKTPAQILHVQTSEELDYDRKSPEERFMDRDALSESSTNGGGDGTVTGTSRWLESGDAKPDDTTGSADSAFQNLKGIFTMDRSSNPFFQPVQGAGWSGSPPVVQPSAAEIARQKADMDAFHALLGEEPVKKEQAPDTVNHYESEAEKARDASASNPLFVNPYGTTFKPLADSAMKPVGLAPLSSWDTIKKKTAPPAWAPKPPPWLSQGPQSLTMQRVGF